MNAFVKTVAAAVLSGVSSASFGANNGVGGYWVDNIITNKGVQNTLMQSATGLNYSYGQTSLLFVSNHHRRVLGGGNSPNMSTMFAVWRDSESFRVKQEILLWILKKHKSYSIEKRSRKP